MKFQFDLKKYFTFYCVVFWSYPTINLLIRNVKLTWRQLLTSIYVHVLFQEYIEQILTLLILMNINITIYFMPSVKYNIIYFYTKRIYSKLACKSYFSLFCPFTLIYPTETKPGPRPWQIKCKQTTFFTHNTCSKNKILQKHILKAEKKKC